MSHIIEVYFNMEPDLYMLDCFMEGMMKTIVKYAPVAIKEPEIRSARQPDVDVLLGDQRVCERRQAAGVELPPHGARAVAVYDITHGLGLPF